MNLLRFDFGETIFKVKNSGMPIFKGNCPHCHKMVTDIHQRCKDPNDDYWHINCYETVVNQAAAKQAAKAAGNVVGRHPAKPKKPCCVHPVQPAKAAAKANLAKAIAANIVAQAAAGNVVARHPVKPKKPPCVHPVQPAKANLAKAIAANIVAQAAAANAIARPVKPCCVQPAKAATHRTRK